MLDEFTSVPEDSVTPPLNTFLITFVLSWQDNKRLDEQALNCMICLNMASLYYCEKEYHFQ